MATNKVSSTKSRAKATQRKPSNSALPKPLASSQAYLECPQEVFKFANTKTVGHSHDIIAQNRAVRAINLGLGIRKPGYNIYVAGIQGTGKTTVIKTFLEKWSKDAETPKDWVYVYDFQNPESPKALAMDAGQGRKLRKKVEQLVKALRDDIPAALQSEDFENAANAYISAANERKSKLFSELERKAKSLSFQVKSSRMGIETIPVVEGRTLTEKEYAKLSEDNRDAIEDRRSQIEPEVLDFARKVRYIEQETREYIEKLREDIGTQVVKIHIEPLLIEFENNKQIVAYFKDMRDYIIENLLDFVEEEDDQGGEDEAPFLSHEERDKFRRFKVNVFVDNTHTKGAPVIIEGNPTYYNLFGKIEKNVEHGMYLTDFTMIKAGAIHKANGGYLVLNALDVFRNPSNWETLKRVLKNRRGFIEDMGEQYSLLPTSGLRPEPIPLDIKVIFIGNDDIYHILYSEDEDFQKIFKVKADFDYKMERKTDNMRSYASWIATRTQIEELLPFDKSGVAAVVEFGSRLVEDQRLLSTQFGQLKDLTIEADFVAREKNARSIRKEHVEEALDQKFYRLNLYEEQLLDLVRNEDILLSVDGETVGQINGLSVYDLGDYSFGKIGRITCTTSISNDGIINIERASKLSGKIHDKGVMILSGFLNAILAKKHSLGLAASICFEQSYGYIDGDSASTAELIAIISAMSKIPVHQSLAVTGSINQFGEIQPVGGINEKVEGFFKTCMILSKNRKNPGPFKVIIPHQNTMNLMLHRDVRKGIDDGILEIYPVKHIWEAFEIATGVELGIKSVFDKEFAPNSALASIWIALEKLRKEKRREHKEDIHVEVEQAQPQPKSAKGK